MFGEFGRVEKLTPSQELIFDAIKLRKVKDQPLAGGKPMRDKNGFQRPQAIVVHYTAGRQSQTPASAIQFMLDMGYGYIFIDSGGMPWKNIHLDHSYPHAGESVMPDFSPLAGETDVSRFAIGIEVACGGKLEKHGEKYQTWFGEEVKNPVFADKEIHGVEGAFQPFRKAQVESLLTTCEKLCLCYGIEADNVVSHHEVSPGRKDDVGGSLPMGMKFFRKMLKSSLDIAGDQF